MTGNGMGPAEANPFWTDIAFISKTATQVSLPQRRTGIRELTRVNGALRVTLQAGPGFNLPSGRYPRVFEMYAATMMVTRDPSWDPVTRTLHLGNSFYSFTKKVGVRTGGKTLRDFREQVLALAHCSYHIKYTDGRKDDGGSWTVSPKYSIYWGRPSAHGGRPKRDTGSWIQFSPEYVAMLMESPVPLNLASVARLTSPLALDIYMWLSHRLYRMRPPFLHVTWKQLRGQFNSETKDEYRFRQMFREQTGNVRKVWPELKLEFVTDGLVVYRSPLRVRTGKAAREFMEGKAESIRDTPDARPASLPQPQPATSVDAPASDTAADPVVEAFYRAFGQWGKPEGDAVSMLGQWRKAVREVGLDTVVRSADQYLAYTTGRDLTYRKALRTWLSDPAYYSTARYATQSTAPVATATAGASATETPSSAAVHWFKENGERLDCNMTLSTITTWVKAHPGVDADHMTAELGKAFPFVRPAPHRNRGMAEDRSNHPETGTRIVRDRCPNRRIPSETRPTV